MSMHSPSVLSARSAVPALSRLWAAVFLGHAAWKQRQHLRDLDDAALADIGLTRLDAEREAARSIWNVPLNWRR